MCSGGGLVLTNEEELVRADVCVRYLISKLIDRKIIILNAADGKDGGNIVSYLNILSSIFNSFWLQ